MRKCQLGCFCRYCMADAYAEVLDGDYTDDLKEMICEIILEDYSPQDIERMENNE